MTFLYKMDTYSSNCDVCLTENVAQMINKWGNYLKFMVTNRIYKYDRDI